MNTKPVASAVLVVDSNDEYRRRLVEALNHLNVEVKDFRWGRDALGAGQLECWREAVLDFYLKEDNLYANGVELLEELGRAGFKGNSIILAHPKEAALDYFQANERSRPPVIGVLEKINETGQVASDIATILEFGRYPVALAAGNFSSREQTADTKQISPDSTQGNHIEILTLLATARAGAVRGEPEVSRRPWLGADLMDRVEQASVEEEFWETRTQDELLKLLHDNEFVGCLPTAPDQRARLSTTLLHLNRKESTFSGVPLFARWLKAAIARIKRTARSPQMAFEEAARQIDVAIRGQEEVDIKANELRPVLYHDAPVDSLYFERTAKVVLSSVANVEIYYRASHRVLQMTGWLIASDLLLMSWKDLVGDGPHHEGETKDPNICIERIVGLFPGNHRVEWSPTLVAQSDEHNYAIVEFPYQRDLYPVELRDLALPLPDTHPSTWLVNVVQHGPNKSFHVAIRNNAVLHKKGASFYYSTNKQEALRGALVLDDRGRAVGVHRGSVHMPGVLANERPVEFVNRATCMEAIAEHIRKEYGLVWDGILADQKRFFR